MTTHENNGYQTMHKKKHYYPNNWRAVNDTESEYFPSIPFDDFYEFHVANWMLPSSHECVIRTTSLKTGKVKEYSYKYRKAAENKIRSLVDTHEFVVCDHEAIHKLSPNPKHHGKKNRADTSS